jgi:muconolactone delta-isomerase
MKKYQANISFDMDEEFMSLVPRHRTYINYLLNKGVIENYTVSMEIQQSWIVINANSKADVEQILNSSPLHKYWSMEIVKLCVYDSQSNRLPAVQLN